MQHFRRTVDYISLVERRCRKQDLRHAGAEKDRRYLREIRSYCDLVCPGIEGRMTLWSRDNVGEQSSDGREGRQHWAARRAKDFVSN